MGSSLLLSCDISGSVCVVVVSVGICGALVVLLFSGADSSSLSELCSCFAIFAVCVCLVWRVACTASMKFRFCWLILSRLAFLILFS